LANRRVNRIVIPNVRVNRRLNTSLNQSSNHNFAQSLDRVSFTTDRTYNTVEKPCTSMDAVDIALISMNEPLPNAAPVISPDCL
jgi:hypothetical protein